MAGPHHQVPGTRLYSERIRLPFGRKPVVKVLRDEEGRYYTDHPLLNGQFASYKQIGDRIRELRNMFEFRIQQPVAAQGPAVMPPRSQLGPPLSEKLLAGATEIASVAALKEPFFSSLEGCLTTMSPEGLITTSPGTASHNTSSSVFYAFRCKVSVTGAAEFAFGQVLQDPYFASSKNLLDTTPEESITAVPQTVPHNAIDNSPSTSPSCYEKLVAGTAEYLPALQDLDGSSLDKFIDEFTTTNGFQQSATSIGSCEELMTAISGTVSHNTGLSSFSIFSCEKFVAGASEFASGKALQDKHFVSSKELPDTTSLEESITAAPEIVPHKTIDGSPSTLQSSYEKFMSGAAETIPTLQDRDDSYLEKILDEIFYSSSEIIAAVRKTVSHNTSDGSPSTLQSSCGKLVSGSAETIPALQDSCVSSFLNRAVDDLICELLDSSSEESIIANLRTVPHSATNGCQQPASSIGSKILIRRIMSCYQAFYIRMDRMGSFWTYPDVGGPFPSLYKADIAIFYFIDELRRGARCKEQYEFSHGDSNYSYFLKGPPKRDPNLQSSKTTYDEKQYLVQALLDQYNGDNDLFGDLAHELKDLVKMHWIDEKPWWHYHFIFTTKQQADDSTGNKLFFAEVSHLLGEKYFEIKCCCIIETEDDGDHCYGCRNNRDPMQHPKNTNAYTGGHFGECPGVILSDTDDDDHYSYDDDDDDDDFDFEIDDADDDNDDGEDEEEVDDVVEDCDVGHEEVDDVVEDCNVGHTRPRIVLDVCV